MGMYDEVWCEYPLSDPLFQNELFQTKDLDNMMEKYTITKDGKLIHHAVEYKNVPEEERPYYGKPEWSSPIMRLAGSIKTIPLEDIQIFIESLDFYTLGKDGLVGFIAYFKENGIIDRIEKYTEKE